MPLDGARMERRRAASGGQGLSHVDALQKLKCELEEVLVEHKNTPSGNSAIGAPFDEDADDGDEDHRITVVRKSSLRISTAIPFNYWSLALLVVSVILLLVSEAIADAHSPSVLLEAAVILIFAALNLWICRREERLKEEEILVRLNSLLEDIDACESKVVVDGSCDDLPPAHNPTSPSISLQWTYRDGALVNLPTSLLVKGDVIVLRPGAVAPSRCRSLRPPYSCDDRQSRPELLRRGDRFLPSTPALPADAPLPQIRQPFSSQAFVLLETPVLRNVRDAVARLVQRQPSLVNLVQSHVRLKVVERYFVVGLSLCHACATVIFYLLYHRRVEDEGDDQGGGGGSGGGAPKPPWALLLARHLVFCLIPILPLARVGWTFLVQCYASACIVNTLKTFGERKNEPSADQQSKTAGEGVDDSLDSRRRFLSGSGKLLELESLSIQEEPASSIVKDFSQELLRLPQAQMRNKGFLDAFFGRIRGPSGFIDRLVDLTHNLATITSICCIDKYGILSFPDPTPEKVFFITSQEADEEGNDLDKDKSGSKASLISLFGDAESSENLNVTSSNQSKCTRGGNKESKRLATSGDVFNYDNDSNGGDDDDESGIFSKDNRIEVLNISHKEERSGYRLQFDDPRWRKYATNLKPLGLHILVNICNDDVIPKHSEFSAHLNCVSHQRLAGVAESSTEKRDAAAPHDDSAFLDHHHHRPLQVLERRCMCDLSSMIGFAPSAKDIFALQHQAYTYRKVKLEANRRRYAAAATGGVGSRANNNNAAAPLRTRHFVRQKVTVPSMTAVLMRERDSGMIQLMSQGTADVVLDSCSDVWDGFDLVPLDDAYRKKIMDFFQRNNLASHCAALSYCPLGCASKLGPFYDDLYVELPSDTKDILDVLLSPSLVRKMGEGSFSGEENWRRGLPVSPFVARLAADAVANDRYLSEESLCRNKDEFSSSVGDKSKLSSVNVKLLHQLTLDRVAAAAAASSIEKTPTTAATTPTSNRNFSPPTIAPPSESNSLQSISECIRQQFEQIFIGMVTMQYQAKLDVIHLIEELEKACIRFVHFSKENELRSRVFSEKMGLEAGWNCHISLEDSPVDEEADAIGQPPPPTSSSRQSSARSGPTSKKSTTAGEGSDGGDGLMARASVSPSSGIPRRSSCPSAIHADSSQVRFVDDDYIINPSIDGADISSGAMLLSPEKETSATERPNFICGGEREGDDENDDEGIINDVAKDGKTERTEIPAHSDLIELRRFDNIPSFDRTFKDRSADTLEEEGDTDANSAVTGNSSHPTTSGMTSSTDRFPIDFSNRAKLPRGVVNVRPHLEKVDNVPLLVSLFTDCTPETSTEMMEIMREYGECVCCIGSCANFSNYRQFSAADIALAVEPMYPRLCSNQVGSPSPSSCASKLVQSGDSVILSKAVSFETAPTGSLIWLSNRINSFPCASLFRRNDDVVICALIALARHLVLVSSSAAEFQLYGQLTVTVLHFLPLLLMAASPLNVPHILWISFVILPLLSLSLVGSPIDPYVMTLSPPKKELFTSAYFARHVVVYLCKFGPTIFLLLTAFYFALYALCLDADGAAGFVGVEDDAVAKAMSAPRNWTNIGNSPQLLACSPFYHFASSNSTASLHGVSSLVQGGTEGVASNILVVQNCVSFFLVLYLIVSSSNFVHRYHSVWKRNPFKNLIWAASIVGLLLLHLLFCAVQMTFASSQAVVVVDKRPAKMSDVPMHAWALLLVWPVTLIGILEALKHLEIKRFVRQQKLQRLNFDTKLGMNSPF